MLIAFFVNDMAKEHPRYTTTMLAHEAVRRGHRVCYITPGDFVLTPDNILRIHARFAPEKKGRSFDEFLKGLEAVADKTEAIDISARSEEHTSELQALMRISYAVFCLQKQLIAKR